MTRAVLSCCHHHHPAGNVWLHGVTRTISTSARITAAILYCDAIINPRRTLGMQWGPRPASPERRARFAQARERLLAALTGEGIAS